MGRRWLRLLVTCLCVVAVVLANTHVGLVLGAQILTKQVYSAVAGKKPSDNAGKGNPATAKCQHCCQGDCPAEDDPQSCSTSSCPQKSDEPGDKPCPCCPKDPHAPSCPFPGGCALCSVAKVPCLNASPTFPPTPWGGNLLVEEAILPLPVYCGELIRPPRA